MLSVIQIAPPISGVWGRLILYYLDMVVGQNTRFDPFNALFWLPEERRRSEQLRKTDIQDLG